MLIKRIELWDRGTKFAELTDDADWLYFGDFVTDETELKALYHCLERLFTGHLTFRGEEYEDVVVNVVF